ncbi:MAG: hypothetical protein R3B96_09995 [Pirellulaceae bacterium]
MLLTAYFNDHDPNSGPLGLEVPFHVYDFPTVVRSADSSCCQPSTFHGFD